MIRLYLILILSLGFTLTLNAQIKDDSSTVLNSNKLYVIIKNDGTEFVGKIISMNAREYLIDTKKMGLVYVPKHEIKDVKEVKEGELNATGEYIPSEVFSTRYFITTNALPIEQGESYVQWNLWGPDLQFGVRKNFGIGIMTSWVGIPVVGTAKYSFNLGKKFNAGIGTLIGTGSWAAPDFGLALPFGSLTYGDRRYNVNFSFGYGAIFSKGDAEGRALLSVGGMAKVGKKISLVLDSFIVPNSSNDPSQNNGIAIIIPGLRWQTNSNAAFQLGFAGIVYESNAEPIPIPMLQWYRKL